jgi:K+-transporting ATPase ATPase B chain
VFGRLEKLLGVGRPKRAAARPTSDQTVVTLQDGRTKPASELERGDLIVLGAGEVIPADGTVVDGIALVDESAITGESAPVIRESGSDRSVVIGGTRVVSSRIVVRVT